MLFTKMLASDMPGLYQSEGKKNPVARHKFFMFGTMWYWFPIEFDGKDTFFGLVINETNVEMGYFSFSELQKLRGPENQEVQVDLDFEPMPISEILKGVQVIR